MNLCRCEKGHFYDKEKFSTCPHCAGGLASDDSLTSVFTEDVTEPVSPAPFFGVEPRMSAAPVPPVAPMPMPLPVADIPADQRTMPMEYDTEDSPTVPLTENREVSIPPAIVEASDDDDHTVGFFDDDFFSAPNTPERRDTSVTVPMPAPVAAPKVNKVSTPCVGWLISLCGEHIGTDFRLKVGKNFIGRSPQMDVALTGDKSVSRERQAVVVYEPKEHLYLVQPGDASTLVYKNNEVVLSPMKLEAYDMITVGEVNLLFIPLCNKNFNWSSLLEEMKNK